MLFNVSREDLKTMSVKLYTIISNLYLDSLCYIIPIMYVLIWYGTNIEIDLYHHWQ